ncbi:hypothetical protein [Streptomyces sp. NPDC005435]|uniref:hypothetical protein n=1 Tax=Streptomyces sp. NPDC005435 TaxID=3154464 RepID=UPI003456517C
MTPTTRLRSMLSAPGNRERFLGKAAEEGERGGFGAVGLDGAMVDRPVCLRGVAALGLPAR